MASHSAAALSGSVDEDARASRVVQLSSRADMSVLDSRSDTRRETQSNSPFQQRRRIHRRAGSAQRRRPQKNCNCYHRGGRGELLHQPSGTEGVNGNGRNQRIGRMVPIIKKAKRGRSPLQRARAAVRPGRDRIGPFQSFPASSQNTFALDAVSNRFVRMVAGQPSALTSGFRGRCSFLRPSALRAERACEFCVAVGSTDATVLKQSSPPSEWNLVVRPAGQRLT
jgi:hypothetical protein